MRGLEQQLTALRKGLWWHPKRREIMLRLHNLMALVDWYRLEAARQEYGDRMRKACAHSRYKYFDVVFYTLQKLLLAYELGLDRGPPKRILDIGTGGGHFPFVCLQLGHSVVGIDIENPVYDRIATCLGVERSIAPVQPERRLPLFVGQFDLIVAWNITFDEVRTADRQKQRAYWSLNQWQFFLDDLASNQLRYPGRIYLRLNKQWRGRAFGFDHRAFDRRLMAMAARNGATVGRRRGTIDIRLPLHPGDRREAPPSGFPPPCHGATCRS